MSEVNLESLTRPFPKEAIRQRKGANGQYLNYVEAHSVIRRLIESTGNDFNFRVLGVDITDGLCMATVELEIGGSKRQHIGTQRMNGGNDDDCVKAAISDAIKKCATLFGVALELYGTDYQPSEAPAPRPVQSQPQGNGNNGFRRPAQVRTGFRPLQSEA